MQINTNVSSLTAQRSLDRAASSLDRTLQRLSSGLRINAAGDDAAGLAISERMTAQIKGTNQSIRNANDGVSILSVAEGSLSTVTSALQRIRELAVQAANSTNSASDRQALQAEAVQLLNSINTVAQQTEFNGDKVFSQAQTSIGGDVNQRAVVDGLKLGWLEEAETRIKKLYGIASDGAAITVDLTGFTDGAGNVLASVSGTGYSGGKLVGLRLNIDMADFVPPNLPDGGSAPFYNDRIIAHEMVHAVMGRSMNFQALSTWFKEGAAEFIHGADERVRSDVAAAGSAAALVAAANIGAWASDSAHYSTAYAATRYLHQKIKGLGGSGIKDLMVYLNQNQAANLDTALNAVTNGTYATEAAFVADWNTNGAAFINGMNLTNADTGAIGGADADNGDVLSAKDVLLDLGNRYGDNVLDGFVETFPTIAGGTGAKDFALQIGANPGQTVTTQFSAININALGISDLDLTTLPQFAIVHLDQAIDFVNQQRAKVGAMQSRMDTMLNQLSTSSENVSAARSRIRDADYAKETAELTRTQINQQAARSMLAQANALPNQVLQLLRG